MMYEQLARRCNVESQSIQDLLKGFVNDDVSKCLKVKKISLQLFVDGGPSNCLALKLGVSSSELHELRKEIEEEGAIGLLIGLMSQRSLNNAVPL